MGRLTQHSQDYILQNLVCEVTRLRRDLNAMQGLEPGQPSPAEENLWSIENELGSENADLDWQPLECEVWEMEGQGGFAPGIDPLQVGLGSD